VSRPLRVIGDCGTDRTKDRQIGARVEDLGWTGSQ
jgi:hypothetical protein